MYKFKAITDKYILWNVSKEDVSIWQDNWLAFGELWQFIPKDKKP